MRTFKVDCYEIYEYIKAFPQLNFPNCPRIFNRASGICMHYIKSHRQPKIIIPHIYFEDAVNSDIRLSRSYYNKVPTKVEDVEAPPHKNNTSEESVPSE